jgi:IMP dehydrogenase
MDTVTESRMAIAMALNGGLGLIHYNMPAKEQVKEVARVKRHIHGLIQDPITVAPELLIGDVLAMIDAKSFSFSTFPVVDAAGRLAGLLSGNVVKDRYRTKRVSEVMTPRSALITEAAAAAAKDPIAAADRFFTANIGINKMLVVSPDDRLKGLITASDVERITTEAKARRKPARDSSFRLVVGAALAPVRLPSGVLDREKILSHVGALVEESIDAVAVSTAHGHTAGVGDMVKIVRTAFPDLTIIAGNVTSAAGVAFLADCGADAIKVGQGPGSICTTRIVAGVGIPQLTALYVARTAAKNKNVKLLADGGITKSGDIVKALTLADAVICGGILAGCREAPGEIMEISGKLYKQYRGMGSLAAMKAGSAARYGHDKNDTARKATAEGIEALKEVSGSLDDTTKAAAAQAQIADFIESLPKGFATTVGERGVRLSGGQRQRIGIARALYKQSPVLVFDEATSALDDATERALMETLDGLPRDLTIIMIAHRLSTTAYCDRVITVSGGSLRETTTAHTTVA